ncbi:hypothetical protein HanOQP8_Chr07g0254781 [Helianthus annuus]|nr:hypothetical protein HanOQP8_Chr07g0254781 [Helianthus annuus]
MWRTAMARATGAIRLQLTEITTTPFHRTYSPSAVINSMILRSLKEHYTEVSKMAPPPVQGESSRAIYSGERGTRQWRSGSDTSVWRRGDQVIGYADD